MLEIWKFGAENPGWKDFDIIAKRVYRKTWKKKLPNVIQRKMRCAKENKTILDQIGLHAKAKKRINSYHFENNFKSKEKTFEQNKIVHDTL